MPRILNRSRANRENNFDPRREIVCAGRFPGSNWPAMSLSRHKLGCFVLEGINSLSTTYFFYYLYFYMQTVHGFGNRANLGLAALNGAIVAVGAYYAGRFAERFGYFRALKIGFVTMMAGLAAGTQVGSASGMILVMSVVTLGMCFTWPTFEALISQGESRSGLQRMIGLYNVVWAGTAALAYFTGGLMLERLGLRSLFFVPLALLACQLGLVLWMESYLPPAPAGPAPGAEADPGTEEHPHSAANPRCFLQMAWLANPLAYVAINTLVAVVPGVANRLGLSTMLAGFCCSVWCFARLGGFFLCWYWAGWHYRFRWMLAAYLLLIAGFAAILMVPNLVVLVIAQLFFGGAVGLIYSSSLFYSMDLTEARGEHGGIHEAAIGIGNFAGPAVGAASLYLWPQAPNSGAAAVSVVLVVGLAALGFIWRLGRKKVH